MAWRDHGIDEGSMFYDKISINIRNIAVCQHTAHHIAKGLNALLTARPAILGGNGGQGPGEMPGAG